MGRSHAATAVLLASLCASPATARAEDSAGVSVKIQFATAIKDREPVDAGDSFAPGKVYCWTEVKGGSGDFRIVHAWIRDDSVVRRQSVRVHGSSWVTWSYHDVGPGHWKVQVQDTDGQVISQGSFTVTAPARAVSP